MIYKDPTYLGGKGESLILLQTLGYNVPEFLIISGKYLDEILSDHKEYLNVLQWLTDNEIDLFSVRSSPEISMPGLMETKLNQTIVTLQQSLLEVYHSYSSDLCKLYRKINNIPDIAPAVIIQKMVDGRGKNSGSGVAYARTDRDWETSKRDC